MVQRLRVNPNLGGAVMARRTTVKEAQEWAAIVGRKLGSTCYPEAYLSHTAWCCPYMEYASAVIGQDRAEAAMRAAYMEARAIAQEAAQDDLY